MKVDPAYSIIKLLGGANRIASVLECDPTRIYRWEYPIGRNEGKNGFIPAKDAHKLLEYAEEEGIDLRPEDFFNSARIRKLRPDLFQSSENAA